MADAALVVLKENLTNLKASIEWVNHSFDQCKEIGIKENYTAEEFDRLENLTSRFARTTDLISNKVLRSIDLAEFIDPGSVIDSANRAVKRGFIGSLEELRQLKDLRNEIVHEYETGDLKDLFALIVAAVPRLLALAEKINVYCENLGKSG
jgi:uncharacterized protein YutE (UPF0331/DUF86 family)